MVLYTICNNIHIMKLKNKILLLTLGLVISTTSSAFWFTNETITIINPSNKASPASVFAQAYKDAIDADFYQASSCEDAAKKFSQTKNAVMIYNGSVEFAARNKGLNCPLKGHATVDNTAFVGQTYMWICRLPGSTRDLGAEETTLGMASMYAVPKHEEQFKKNGANVKIVPYGGSKGVLKALRAGDIDLGWMGSGLAKKQGDKLDCLYSTDPNADNFLGKTVPKTIPDFRIAYVVYTNTTNKSIMSKLRDVANSQSFNQYMNKSLITGTWDVTTNDINGVINYIDLMENTWVK
jgi:hypothetical protein